MEGGLVLLEEEDAVLQEKEKKHEVAGDRLVPAWPHWRHQPRRQRQAPSAEDSRRSQSPPGEYSLWTTISHFKCFVFILNFVIFF